MAKRKVIETIEEYDGDGKLTKKTTIETTEGDDAVCFPSYPTFPAVNTWNLNVTHETGASFPSTTATPI